MSGGADEGEGKGAAGESAVPATVSPAAPMGPLPPTFGRYLALNLGAWGFIAASGFVFWQSLGASRGIVLFCVILAAGFTLASMFDYCWLRWGRRGG